VEKLSEEAKQIVKQNLYLCLATVKLDNTPWVSPVYFNYDENFTLYWRSGKDSLHSQLITKNSHVAIAIFNSQVPWGTGTGVYLEAIAAEVPPKELTKALKAFYGGPHSPPQDYFNNPKYYIGELPRRIYQATPKKFWILGSEEIHGQPIDKRIEINLKDKT